MGQYYRFCALKPNWRRSKEPIKAQLNSWDFDCGAKLMEHSYINNPFVGAAMNIIKMLDKGNGVTCVWIGDYADKVKCGYKKDVSEHNIFSDCGEFEEKHPKIQKELNAVSCEVGACFAVNHTKKQYVKIDEFNPTRWTYNPLPLLLASGNGLGGGDYDEENGKNAELIGAWAFDKISIVYDVKKFKRLGYTAVGWKLEYDK